MRARCAAIRSRPPARRRGGRRCSPSSITRRVWRTSGRTRRSPIRRRSPRTRRSSNSSAMPPVPCSSDSRVARRRRRNRNAPVALGDQVLDACPELNRGDAPVTRTNSLETVRNMVASGLGVSVLPRDALTPKYHSRLVIPVPFTKPTPARRIALAYRRSFPRPAAIAAIRDAVTACRAKGRTPRAA